MEEKEDLKKQVSEQINKVAGEGIKPNNIDMLGRLVDIDKDIANMEYWEKKKEVMEMNYRGYGEYNEGYGNYGNEGYGRRGVPGSGRGRRRYSARGGRGSYRGDEALQDMHEKYQDYSEGKEEYNAGNYSAKKDTMKSLDYMLQSVVDFMEMLKEDASSQEEVDMIKHYSKKIAEM